MTTDAIAFTYSSPQQKRLRRTIIRLVEAMTGQLYLKKLYEQFIAAPEETGQDFFTQALLTLEVDLDYNRDALDAVPRTGPVLFIANHPYGVIDGLALTAIARQTRPDVRVMANDVLCRAPQAAAHLLPVNFDGNADALKTNMDTRKTAIETLISGGAIGIFPGGGVATSIKPFWGAAADPEWHVFLARLVQKTGATIIPIYFDGQNSRLFQIASHFSYTMRLALYFRETRRMVGHRLHARIGAPITAAEMAPIKDKTMLTRYLRAKTFDLACGIEAKRRKKHNMPNAEQVFRYPARLRF